jgi:ABC-type phosphate transport system ATPase subunit
MEPQKIAIAVDDLTVAYNYKPVLWDIDLAIPEGVLMAIVGPCRKINFDKIYFRNYRPNCRKCFYLWKTL